ncbi:N-acyl homoserine lactonase family protein [Phytoactinopolyspora alkaliphila]|uniref:N-acyl homoserine lactonase family protein n=2 Tax=Phytoactinopolyspora alkaliphila TaxID=1783498 RepID=A0A6N9YPN2_9ACTN|nr:N-acyl homoserine lactonase family protein [Phytoactinopolyspora alkaliphila]
MRPEHVGPTRKPMPLWLFTSTRWTAPRPVSAFVIEHRDGVVLFDTGQDRTSVTDPRYFPGRLDRLVNSRIARFDIPPDQTLTAGLIRLGYRLGDVETAVISHLHPDHIGGLPLLAHASIVVSRDEWAGLERRRPEARGLYRKHIDLPGLRWNRIGYEPLAEPRLEPFSHGYDLFGDRSVLLLPTLGHTPGSLSMLVRRPGKASLLLVGDLTYDEALLASGQPSGMCDRKQTRVTMQQVNKLRAALRDLVILPSHDPGAAERLAAAM